MRAKIDDETVMVNDPGSGCVVQAVFDEIGVEEAFCLLMGRLGVLSKAFLGQVAQETIWNDTHKWQPRLQPSGVLGIRVAGIGDHQMADRPRTVANKGLIDHAAQGRSNHG